MSSEIFALFFCLEDLIPLCCTCDRFSVVKVDFVIDAAEGLNVKEKPSLVL